jgi:site-specific recombinase XerC
LTEIRPFDVAAYVERLQGEAAAPSVKQELAALRILFDWLVVGQMIPSNPASSVRGPAHVVKTGKTRCSTAANGAGCSMPYRLIPCGIGATGR